MTDPMPAIYDDLGWPTGLRPASLLPTIPGIYADKVGDPWSLFAGQWIFEREEMPIEKAILNAPFTRLRPEAEVAAEVLAAVEAVAVPVWGIWANPY